MRPSGDPQIGPVGPYHHPHHLPHHHVPYHVEQIPTTSHPSWHQTAHAGLPTPPSPYHHPQQHPPQTVSYPMVPQPHPQQQIQQQQQQMQQQQQLQQQQIQQQQQQQQQIQQNQRSANYLTPSPSRGPSAPPQNQKFRTEQWINNQQPWSYAQSPSTPIVPSVMSYQGGADDRMSMLSVNTQMTNQYPESQRCYSSNGSTCENVNPELTQINVAQLAEQALVMWPTTPDIGQRVKFAKAIRDWIREDKFAHVDQASLPKLVQGYLDIIHDGLRTQNPQFPIQYFASLFYYLLDTLRYITALSSNSANLYFVIQRFSTQNSGPLDFRELVCQFLHPQYLSNTLRPCTTLVFQILNCIITHMKQEKWRAEFAQSLKFPGLVYTLMAYFDPNFPIHVINQHVFTILRYVLSKDAALKDCIIWTNEQQREALPKDSIILRLNSVLIKAHQFLIREGSQNPEHAQVAIHVITHTLQLVAILLHNTVTIDAFIRVEGVNVICTVLSASTPELARAAFSFLLKISDSPALGTISLAVMLPFLLEFISRSQDNEVLYFGTGFLSNVVANKQHVKDLAIQNNAILLLYQTFSRIPRLTEVKEVQLRNRFCETMCNCLRTLNNFLLLWVPTSHGTRPAGDKERAQVCQFIEVDLLRKLMSCLSAEGIETPGLMELRSTIIRFFHILFRTPFVPKNGLLNIIDDSRNENLVGHICAAYSWARRQRDEPRTAPTKQQLMERTINVLKVMMEQCGEKQVAESTYSIECPLNLISDHMKQSFLLTVLMVCDKILEHCPTRADIWSIDRAMLEGLTNHQNSDIALVANKVLTRFPETDLLAGFLSSSEFF